MGAGGLGRQPASQPARCSGGWCQVSSGRQRTPPPAFLGCPLLTCRHLTWYFGYLSLSQSLSLFCYFWVGGDCLLTLFVFLWYFVFVVSVCGGCVLLFLCVCFYWWVYFFMRLSGYICLPFRFTLSMGVAFFIVWLYFYWWVYFFMHLMYV